MRRMKVAVIHLTGIERGTLPPQFGQSSMSIIEDSFEQSGPTHARRRTLRLRVIACGRGCFLLRTGDDFTTQLCVRRKHAMEAD